MSVEDDQLLEIADDGGLKSMFEKTTLPVFWNSTKNSVAISDIISTVKELSLPEDVTGCCMSWDLGNITQRCQNLGGHSYWSLCVQDLTEAATASLSYIARGAWLIQLPSLSNPHRRSEENFNQHLSTRLDRIANAELYDTNPETSQNCNWTAQLLFPFPSD
ncbi:unnamed protein product, partial [Pleuronectes platessa]